MWIQSVPYMKMSHIKNVVCYQCKLSIFSSDSYALCCRKTW